MLSHVTNPMLDSHYTGVYNRNHTIFLIICLYHHLFIFAHRRTLMEQNTVEFTAVLADDEYSVLEGVKPQSTGKVWESVLQLWRPTAMRR